MKEIPMKDKKKIKDTSINDLTALRAFVMPDLYVFLLEAYLKDGKTENFLKEDIEKARECYKELLKKQKSSKASQKN